MNLDDEEPKATRELFAKNETNCEYCKKATQNNWKKLNKSEKNKLTSRANKRLSLKKIIPVEYISDKEDYNKIIKILNFIDNKNWKIEDIIYSLAINMIKINNLDNKKNVNHFLKEYSVFNVIDELVNYDIKNMHEYDLLGVIYQCLISEGEKNKKGSYYTPKSIVNDMTGDLFFSESNTFLDPCCGSGAYLLSLNVKNPKQIYGIDTDAIAVMIAKINLIIKYKTIDFEPNIYNIDFLKDNIITQNQKFDYIITNPPWGAMTQKEDIPKEIDSDEIFSCFIVKSIKMLQKNGIIRFLLPISILNVKKHKDIRKYILENTNLSKIKFYEKSFTGVVTKYINLEIDNEKKTDDVIILKDNSIETENKKNFELTKNYVFSIVDSEDIQIIKKIKKYGKYYLNNSIWALGIVTGDNKNSIKEKYVKGYEPIYTGKDIGRYTLKNPKGFIKYDRDSFQQVAKDEYYRAPEKLVYKFISNKLTFAYDNEKRLFLNSANILIPNIPGMSTKTVLAYLNSNVFTFYYTKLFGEIKILKNNLMEIPFPKITKEENYKIEKLIDNILYNTENDKILQDEIYKTYGLNNADIEKINNSII